MKNNISKIIEIMKEGGCKVGDDVPDNEFGEKFIDVNGIAGCARDLERLGREHFLAAYKQATTPALISETEG